MIDVRDHLDRLIERLHDALLAHGKTVAQAEGHAVVHRALEASHALRDAIYFLQGMMNEVGHYLEGPDDLTCGIRSC